MNSLVFVRILRSLNPRRSGFIASISFVTTLLTIELSAQVPAKEKPGGWTPQLMMQMKRIGGVRVSPDGERVVFTVRQAGMEGGRSEYLAHIHLAKADGSSSFPLTQGDKSCDDPQWSPSGKWIAFQPIRQAKCLADFGRPQPRC